MWVKMWGDESVHGHHSERVRAVYVVSQSKSMIAQPVVVDGSVKPVSLHGMIIVLRFICHVGGVCGTGPAEATREHSNATAAKTVICSISIAMGGVVLLCCVVLCCVVLCCVVLCCVVLCCVVLCWRVICRGVWCLMDYALLGADACNCGQRSIVWWCAWRERVCRVAS